MFYNSQLAYKQAIKSIPGGVNSPVRAFRSVDSTPVFFKSGNGSKMIDIDDNEYIDCVGSWGPLIFGHADNHTIEAIVNCSKNGTTFGAPTELETKMASKIIEMVPSIEKVRMVSSGTEATMSAIRLARGYTRKNLIIKFSGNYHGHFDGFLIKAGSGAMTLGTPDSQGVTENIAKDTLVAEFNDIDSVNKLFNENKDKIAAVIVEPIAGNMGLVIPENNFLNELRAICTENNSLLIFDEVMSGFRVSKGGAQELYDVIPDITTLGKIIGGGLPAGAYGGKSEIMDHVAPDGPVYQAGTLSGNPIAVSAGAALLKQLANKEIYTSMEKNAQKFLNPIKEYADELNIPFSFNVRGGMFGFFFSNSLPKNFDDVQNTNIELFSKFFRKMLEKNIYLPPSAYESCFISTLHDEAKMLKAAKLAQESLKEIKDEI